MKLIVSELTGGLGNQLFQYATGFAAAQRAGATFALDLRHYDIIDPSMPSRPFAMDRFALSAGEMTLFQRLRVDYTRLAGSPRRVVRLLGKLPGYRLPILFDRAEGDDERLHRLRTGAYLVGVWQTEKLFKDYRPELLKEFTFKNPVTKPNAEMIAKMRQRTAISVHFRRTDYLGPNTSLRPVPMDYYERALALMNTAYPDAAYFIFTDDPEWVRANAILPERHTIVTHNTGVDDGEDMRLMASCDHFIIANSSFSWWGAWLGTHPEKRVIAPATWYVSGHSSEPELVPEDWIKV